MPRCRPLRASAALGPLLVISLACTSGPCAPQEEEPPPWPSEAAATSSGAAEASGGAETAAEPAVGDRGLARFQSGTFAYAAVVTGREDAGALRVVYADGDTETVPATSFYSDTIGPGSRVEARVRAWNRYYPGRVQRRVSHAVFVHFDDGEEHWTSVGMVRLPVSEAQRGRPPAEPERPSGGPLQPGSAVLANFRAEGWFYPAVVAERRGDGRLHVIYADGDSEWVTPDRVRPDALGLGSPVQAQPAANGPIQQGEITRRVGHAVELRLDTGQRIWVALARIRTR